MSEGEKHDAGKPDWTLMPWAQLESVQRVLDHGAKKYGAWNWQSVPNPHRRYLAALIRHLVGHIKGEPFDKDSGQPHMAHIICCALFLIHFDWQDKSYGRSDWLE